MILKLKEDYRVLLIICLIGDRTKWYGQNGTDKMVYGQNGIRTKWYGQNGTILCFVYILIQLNSIYI